MHKRKEGLEDVFENINGYAPYDAPEGADYVYYNAGVDIAEPMEVDAQPEAPEEQEALNLTEVVKKMPTCLSLLMGAGSQSYLHHGTEFTILQNEGTSVALKPGKKPFSINLDDGTPVESSHALLTNNETAMNMLSANDTSKLFHANIERSQVVSEWELQKDGVSIEQLAIAPGSKADQVNANPYSMLSMAEKGLYRWDLRVRDGVVQESGPLNLWDTKSGHAYTGNPKFTCIAVSGGGSDGNGHVVVGSADGTIRLYNSASLKAARTTIAGLGKPITAVDVTYDGQWVIATTDDYVMVVNTSYKDNGSARSAFTHAGRNQIQAPRLLRLTPEDRRKTQNAPLKNARFSWVMEDNNPERWISATCGKHTVLWNFRRVKTARSTCTSHNGMPTLHEYQLSAPSPEDIRDSRFMHSSSARDARVVATKTKLYTLKS